MHRQLINEAIIHLAIEPDGPILIKSGESGADPTRPDMEFVRTYHEGEEIVYLPGSSLKGVIRSHAERITRTVDPSLSCNPLGEEKDNRKHNNYSCNKHFTKKELKDRLDKAHNRGAEVYKESCFVCRMFGNTALSSHVKIADAYPVGNVRLEERNGVAIDRIFGSVAVGPFQFEVATQGTFKTQIYIKNFTIAQLGLIGLVLRDIQEQRVPIGFGKSRGLGKIKAHIGPMVIKYPMGGFMKLEDGKLCGVGTLVSGDNSYGFPESDFAIISDIQYKEDGWCGKNVVLEGAESGKPIYNLWVECVKKWVELVQRRDG